MVADSLTTKAIAELAQPLFRSPVKELSELIGDRARLWRYRSAVNIMKRAREIREENGIAANDVSLKFFLPFIEEASKKSENKSEIHEL